MKYKEIEALLPDVFQRTIHEGNPLSALLQAMEVLHDPADETLTYLERYFDPYRTPEKFVPFLARWVDLERLLTDSESDSSSSSQPFFPSGLGRLRDLIVNAAYLSKWRGTARGLKSFLEIATGIEGFKIDEQVLENGEPKPFHIKIHAPANARAYKKLITRIIEMEKPAYVTYELKFGS